MADRKTVVDSLTLTYTGVFSVNELYRIMDKWFREKGFDKYEKRSCEQVYKDSSQVDIEWEPWKKINDYARIVMRVFFYFTDIKEVTIVKDHHKVKLNQATVRIVFNTYLESDWEGKWKRTPFLYMLRVIFDQYIYKYQLDQYYTFAADDTMLLYNFVKTYLNMHRY